MATKKKVGSKKNTAGKTLKQTDDPIIVKPGGSLLIEMDKRFSDPHTPASTKRKGHKHPRATRLARVVILDEHEVVKQWINITGVKDSVMICYDTPDGCDCL